MAQDTYGQGALDTAQGNVNNAVTAGVSGIQGANNQGQNAINSFNPQDVGGAQLGTGPQNATDYMKQYSQTVANNPQMTQAYNTANQLYNVQGQQNQANYLNQQVNQALPNAYAVSRGFDVSAPQAQNYANTQLSFLQPEANAATQNAQTAQNLAQGYVTQQQAQNTTNLLPIQSYGNMMTQEQNNVYQGLIAKVNAGVSLSSAEMAQLQALESQAASSATSLGGAGASYAGQLAANQAGITEANIGQQYKTLNPNQTVYNVNSGANYSPYQNFANTLQAGYNGQ